MEHIVKTYILLLFSLLVSSIGYAQEENDIIYIQEVHIPCFYFVDAKCGMVVPDRLSLLLHHNQQTNQSIGHASDELC